MPWWVSMKLLKTFRSHKKSPLQLCICLTCYQNNMQIQQVVFTNYRPSHVLKLPLLTRKMWWNIYLQSLTNHGRMWNHVHLSVPAPNEECFSTAAPGLHLAPGTAANPAEKLMPKGDRDIWSSSLTHMIYLWKTIFAFTLLFKIQGHKHTENLQYYGNVFTREFLRALSVRNKNQIQFVYPQVLLKEE